MEEKNTGKKPAGRRFRGLKIAVGVFIGFWAVLVIVLHILLHSSFLPRTVSRLAEDYIDGDVEIGRLEASVFRHFPNINLTAEDLRLTYPHDKFAAYDTVGVAARLREAGRAAEADTLAAFRRFELTLNLSSLLRGRFHIRRAELDGAQIYAHRYDAGDANWNILTFLQPDSSDTVSAPLPRIRVDKAALTGRPRIVFTDPSDTLFATVRTEGLRFDGRLLVHDPLRSRIRLDVDSLFVAGRLPADTLALSLDHFGLYSRRGGRFHLDAAAHASLAMGGIGRVRLPLGLKADIAFPEQDFRSLSVRDLELTAATLPLTGQADFRMDPDSLYIRADLSMPDCPVQETLHHFAQVLDPDIRKLSTDARISITALCDGYYVPSTRSLPELIAEVSVPACGFSWQGLGSGRLGGLVVAQSDETGRLSATVDDLDLDFSGVCLTGSGFAEDLLSDDPLIGIDLEAQADLDALGSWLPEGIVARGRVRAALSGMMLLSDMDPYNFARADLDGRVTSPGIFITDDADSLTVFLGKTDIRLDKTPDAESGVSILGLSGQADTLFASYGRNIFVRSSRLRFDARNGMELLREDVDREIHPIVGTISAAGLAMTGSDSLFVGVRNTANTFRYGSRNVGGTLRPHLSMASRNDRVFFRQKTERLSLKDVSFSASAVQRVAAGGRARRSRQAGLAGRTDGDSLGRPSAGGGLRQDAARRARRSEMLPDYLQDKDFRARDIDIRLDSAMSRYIRDWDLQGTLAIGEGLLLSPYFPLRSILSQARGSFTTDEILLDNADLSVGRSDISAAGKISGLRRAMLREGIIRLDLNVGSGMLDANELLTAFDAGARYRPDGTGSALDESVSDTQYLEQISAEIDPDSPPPPTLVVIPSNVVANIHLQGDAIRYADLDIDWFASDIVMKERTLQITNTVAMSNMGDIYFEGFYSTKSKQDLTAGFNLNLADITAEKVITLLPAVDSIMPMLKSFKGMLDCEMAATARLDTAMNLVAPSLRGIMRISGKGLSIEESGELRKIARLLMFKDTKIGHIDDMSVEGIIGNNTLEIFPFILGVDRYQLAMSGLQHFDQQFDYHLSILRSPLPFRFGVNVFGNFDNWHYRIGKARYKSTDVPVFTTRIDTLQYNLVHSIHDIFVRGVDAAVRQTQREQEALSQAMEEIILPMEELSDDEHALLDSLLADPDPPAEETSPVPQEMIPVPQQNPPKQDEQF